jgi:hypothetical protein
MLYEMFALIEVPGLGVIAKDFARIAEHEQIVGFGLFDGHLFFQDARVTAGWK